jgi:hypothetical protein
MKKADKKAARKKPAVKKQGGKKPPNENVTAGFGHGRGTGLTAGIGHSAIIDGIPHAHTLKKKVSVGKVEITPTEDGKFRLDLIS